MLLLQDDIRFLVNHDIDCSEASIRLMAMRVEMVRLIRQRDAMGGVEACPNIAERLKEHHRPELRRRAVQKTAMANEKPGRSRAHTV
jgi:hypothetical protein